MARSSCAASSISSASAGKSIRSRLEAVWRRPWAVPETPFRQYCSRRCANRTARPLFDTLGPGIAGAVLKAAIDTHRVRAIDILHGIAPRANVPVIVNNHLLLINCSDYGIMAADSHSKGNSYVALKRNTIHRAKPQRLHSDRASGCDSNYCAAIGNIDAFVAEGSAPGPPDRMWCSPEILRLRRCHVLQ